MVTRPSARFGGGAALVAAAALLLPSVALAEGPTAAQDAQAEDLFQRAKAAMLKKNYAQACPWFAESYGLAGGGGTLQNLAICYEEEGKLAFAYNRFIELRLTSLKAGNHPERVKLAEEHIEKLKPRLSRLRVRVADQDKAVGAKVTVDGDAFGEASWDAGIVVNRGAHVVRVTAPGKKAREVAKSVPDEGTLVTVDVPPLEADAAAVAPVVPPPPPSRGAEPEGGAMRGAGFVLVGVGAGAVVAGSVFGVLTITTNSAAKNACLDTTAGQSLSQRPLDPASSFDASGKCYSGTDAFTRANELHDRARTFGTVSTILIPVGLVAAGLGTYFILTSPSESGAKPAISARVLPGLGGLTVAGEFR